MDNVNDKINELEAILQEGNMVNCPLKHTFADGQYIREIFMPAGTYVTSLIHKTKHPFFILKGKVTVISENDGEQILEAPYSGITTPNTRRALYIHEDCIWATVHKTNVKPTSESEEDVLTAVALIKDEIIDNVDNPLLKGQYVNNKLVESSNKMVAENIY